MTTTAWWMHSALAIAGTAGMLGACGFRGDPSDNGPAANQDPVAATDAILTTENVAAAVDVLLNDSDPDVDPLTVTSFRQGAHGSVTFAGATATYIPATDYVGADQFTYTVSDGRGGTTTGTVAVTIANQAPVAVDDVLAVTAGAQAQLDVQANDSDPDSDPLTVISFTQGAHGSVTFSGSTATYSAAADYAGGDAFTYTIDDGHGITATGTVMVAVTDPVPGCAISLAGPPSGSYGAPIHLVATAQCNTGAAEVQWYHRINSSYEVVQAWSAATAIDVTAGVVGTEVFYAAVRTQGTASAQGTSSALAVPVADDVASCTKVAVTAPSDGQVLTTGAAQSLTASAVCPQGATPEFQFWIKPSSTSRWTVLPGYTTGAGAWTPATAGSWNVKAVARAQGAHVTYQIASTAVTVTVAP